VESEGPGIIRLRAGETETEEAGYEGEYVGSKEGPAIEGEKYTSEV
jgi:hypothetical protein